MMKYKGYAARSNSTIPWDVFTDESSTAALIRLPPLRQLTSRGFGASSIHFPSAAIPIASSSFLRRAYKKLEPPPGLEPRTI